MYGTNKYGESVVYLQKSEPQNKTYTLISNTIGTHLSKVEIVFFFPLPVAMGKIEE